ncbi:hypothetical protein, partial [Mesorhizobium sp.]|uniref:hypothetical protein n=1 Tax=Mesorhizobium sp. TaxID=1871066 RepID=UPI00257A8561
MAMDTEYNSGPAPLPSQAPPGRGIKAVLLVFGLCGVAALGGAAVRNGGAMEASRAIVQKVKDASGAVVQKAEDAS